MKKLIYLLAITLLISSCSSDYHYECVAEEYVDVTITKVSVAKHSTVQGMMQYGKFTFPVKNSESGYHYKEYNLVEGEVIHVPVRIYQEVHNNATIVTCETNFNLYETHQ